MGEILAVECDGITVVDSSDNSTVDKPIDLVLGPVDGIFVECVYSITDSVCSTAIVACGVALSKEIALNLVGLGSDPLQINLIEVGRFENEGRNNTGSWRSLHDHRDLSEHDVLVHRDGRSFGRLDCEEGTITSVCHGCAICGCKVAAFSLGEVGCEISSKTRFARTCCEDVSIEARGMMGIAYSSREDCSR